MSIFFTFITIIGTLSTILSFAISAFLIIIWIRGIAPVLYRVGDGLAHKKIIIFAKGDNLISLKSLLEGSKLFRKKNLDQIVAIGDLDKAANGNIFLVYWPDWSDSIDEILDKMDDRKALVIYAPGGVRSIVESDLLKISKKKNVAISNFRGRLLNDITTSIITISN